MDKLSRDFGQWYDVPSVLRHCWLGIKKSIWSVKTEWWGVGVIMSDCLHMVQLMPLNPKIPSSLGSFKSILVLHFCYQLTHVVLQKRLLNGCSSAQAVVSHYTGWPQKNVPNFRMALCNRVGEMNQQKSIHVMSKHLRICLWIFT